MELPKQPILWVDATPDKRYALRILEAYRKLCNYMWAEAPPGEEPGDALRREMNTHQIQRAAILDKAIRILERALGGAPLVGGLSEGAAVPPLTPGLGSPDPQKMLGQALVKGAFLSPQDLDKSLEESRNTGRKLVDVLLSRQLVSPETLVTIMSFALNAPVVDMRQIRAQPEAVALIPESIARQYGVMPIFVEGDVLRVAMENPQDLQLVDTLNAVSGKRVKPVLPLRGGIQEAIKKNYSRKERKGKDEKEN